MGGDVTTKQVHPWQLWDQGGQGTFMGMEQDIGDVRHHDMMAFFLILHNNHRPCLQLRMLGMF